MSLDKILRAVDKVKSKVDPFLDQLLFFSAAESSLLYGLYKIADSSPSYINALSSSAYTVAAIALHKKVIFPLAKKLLRHDKKKAKREERKKKRKVWSAVPSWLKTSMLALALYFPLKQDVANTNKFYYNNVVSSYVQQVVLDEKNSDGIGRIERTERFLPLIRKYEKMFSLPKYTLYAIVAQESYGDPLHINHEDGGSGLVHWQPISWEERGNVGPKEEEPDVFYNTDILASKEYAKKLMNLIESTGYNLKTLSQIDNRFDPDINLYETAEYIHDNYNYYISKYNKSLALNAAIASVNTGRRGAIRNGKLTKRAKRYLKKVNHWRSLRENERFMNKVRASFNKKNKIPFEKYVKYFNLRYK